MVSMADTTETVKTIADGGERLAGIPENKPVVVSTDPNSNPEPAPDGGYGWMVVVCSTFVTGTTYGVTTVSIAVATDI